VRELGHDDRVLIVCSDGVWEHVDNKAATECVMQQFDEGRGASGATKALMDLSMRNWKNQNPAYRDDITALVADIPRLLEIMEGSKPRTAGSGNSILSGKNQQAPPAEKSEGPCGPTYRRPLAYKVL